MTGFLALEDGAVFRGESVGAPGFAFGEAVFATSMTGYQELVTDPSYAEQLLCFTAPMVGNYGVAGGRSESSRVHARGALMREAKGPAWTDWLHERGIPALSGVDTRSLVLHLREQGAMRGIVVAGGGSVDEALRAVNERPSMKGRALVADVSTPQPYVYSDLGRVDVAVVDYGCKRSILRRLAGAGAAVTVYPHDVDADDRARIWRALDGLPPPVRKLELVVYAAGAKPPAYELNYPDGDGEPGFWFVLDAAIAQERSRPLRGRPWRELLEPVTEAETRRAAEEMVRWADERDDEFARPHGIRARHYLEHGDWMTKQEARR